LSRAGDRIRTDDIHVGKVDPQVAQPAAAVQITAGAEGARSKYAAKSTVRIKRVILRSVGEWPRDPNHAFTV
jgi:hypothetical protein